MALSAAGATRRRAMLLAAGGLALPCLAAGGSASAIGGRRAAAAGAAGGSAPPEAATLLVPGPAGSPHLRWAARFAAGAGRAAPPHQGVRLRVATLGGADGVTAANRFATTAAPDGRMLLALAGAAVHARLVGDGRAHYEPSAWLPICAIPRPTALLIRRGFLDTAAATRRAAPPAPLRLALPAPEAPEAAALLALDLLGVRAEPTFGLAGEAAEAALAQGRVDALLYGGPGLAARARAIGGQPWFAVEPPAGGERDSALAGVPGFTERVAAAGTGGAATAAARDAIAAARAGLAAVRLGATIVLPALTPADRVTLWRHAAARWAEEEQEDAPDPADPRHPVLGAAAAAAFAALCAVPEPVVDAYRGWLSRRLNWRAA